MYDFVIRNVILYVVLHIVNFVILALKSLIIGLFIIIPNESHIK